MSSGSACTHLSATIPIDLHEGILLDPDTARQFGREFSGYYCSREPYPHIVLDDFLPKELADQIISNFPENRERIEKEYELNYTGIQEFKRQVAPIRTNYFCRNIFGFFNSSSFVEFLENLTKIDGLIPDCHFNGGGFHELNAGGKLGIHADFRVHERLHLGRRINVLIYLNENWNLEWGGNLELWDKAMKTKTHSIAPLFNRCVIFNTDATSYHGHPDPLNCPTNVTRKSIALYYYTASKAIYEEIPSSTTMYVSRPNESASSKRKAFKLRAQNYAKDFLPPILFRAIRDLKTRIQGL